MALRARRREQVESVISQLVHPALRYKIEDATLLADLGFTDAVDKVGLQCAVEEFCIFEFEGNAYTSWNTVRDVLTAIDKQCDPSLFAPPDMPEAYFA